MGVVHGPDDILNRRRRIEAATRDLNPGVRELVQNIVNSWSGGKSMEELKRVIGEEKARQIVKELNLSED
ncbi:MAG: hypothetical protein QXW09_07180 [Thermoproteota archaeon]